MQHGSWMKWLLIAALAVTAAGSAWAQGSGGGSFGDGLPDKPGADCYPPTAPIPIDACDDETEIDINGIESNCKFWVADPPADTPQGYDQGAMDMFALVDCLSTTLVGIGPVSFFAEPDDDQTGVDFGYTDSTEVTSACMREASDNLPVVSLTLDSPSVQFVAKIRKVTQTPGSGLLTISLNDEQFDVPTTGLSKARLNRNIANAIGAHGFDVIEAARYFIVTGEKGTGADIHYVRYFSGDDALINGEVALEAYNVVDVTNCSAP